MAKAKATREVVPLRVCIEDWETEDSLLLLRGWKRDGLSDRDVAKKMGIAPETLCRWKARSESIRQCLSKTKEIIDRELEESMYKRAKGFYVYEWVEEYRYDENGNEFLTYRKKNRKFIPPSETMQIFLSKHGIRGKWLDEKTEADKKEQDARIAKLQKDAQDDDKASEIKIVIEGGDEYAD